MDDVVRWSILALTYFRLFNQRIVKFLLGVMLFSITSCAFSAVKPVNQIWTLSALSNLALSLNPATKLAWAQVQSAAAGIGLASSSYWPSLDYELASSYVSGNRNNNFNNFGCNSSDQYCSSMTLNYLLWDFGARSQQLKSAKYLFLASQLSQNETIQTVILLVDQAYYQLLGQQELLKANQISLNEAQTNLKSATALHAQGLATSSDVYQAKSAYSEAELALEQTQGQVLIAQGQLAIAVGLPVQTHLKIASLAVTFHNNFSHDTIYNLLIQANNQRPDLLAAQAQLAAQQAAVQVAKRQRWPTINVQMSTQNSQASNTFNSDNRQNNLLFTLNFPLFTGFAQTNTIRQAEAVAGQVQAQRDQLANQISMQVWQAYYNLQVAQASVATSQTYLKSSIQAAKQTLGQYQAGVGNILSVLTTQTTEANAREQLIQSSLNWYLAAAQLTQAIGALQ